MVIQVLSQNGRMVYRKKPSAKYIEFLCGVVVGILLSAIAIIAVVR